MFAKTLLKNVKISTKFNILLMIAIALGAALSGMALATVLEREAQSDVATQATLLMQTMNSLRDYTQESVNPLLEKRLETETAFIPQAIPNFSVREVFEKFRTQPDYQKFFYKDATLNPTNPRDRADEFEASLIERFRNASELKELSGFHTVPEGQFFYIARPLVLNDQTCLQCHSTPAIAPKSLIATYGSKNGFNWKLNEVQTAQIIFVPVEAVLEHSSRSLLVIVGVLLGVFVLIFLLINILLQEAIIRRIRKIANTANAVSMGEFNASFDEDSKDEIGALAIAFNRMRSSLQIAMEMIQHRKNS